MSAAEKLKALDVRLHEGDYDVGSELAMALPQIVAVVEAAEQLPTFFDVDEQVHSFVPLLDALDEALEAT